VVGLPPELVLQSRPFNRKPAIQRTSEQVLQSQTMSDSLLVVNTSRPSCSRVEPSKPASLCLPAELALTAPARKEGTFLGETSWPLLCQSFQCLGSSHVSRVVPSEWVKQPMYSLENFLGVSYEASEEEVSDLFSAIES
jgi:hypothetical protein